MNSRQSYIDDLQNAWRNDDEYQGIVPDGTRLTIPMVSMDADQAAIRSHQMDAQPELEPDKQQALDTAQRNHDKIAAWSDHYSRQRNLRTLAERPATAYDQFCHSLSTAWRAA